LFDLIHRIANSQELHSNVEAPTRPRSIQRCYGRGRDRQRGKPRSWVGVL